jgi:Domain of unknown function (DUF4864)
MKRATRFAIVGASLFLCATSVFLANSLLDRNSRENIGYESVDSIDVTDAYQYAACGARPKLTFQQLEAIIRSDPVAKSQRGRMEFGSMRMEQGTALAQVVFVGTDGRVQPFLYKLLREGSSWKIVNVQRMWFMPRSHLLRGVRA